ncbi:Pls/PosA family non-ribosomal peptide synthetase [Corynebacterium epidermidicanis]|uniref:Amino acid adenylation enzyme/thioester reductase family protein n=1 Tax=Corynebacterium epidermidicanis TaxID=1050174 RepID=A0A0G3GWT0_9CORY|nr:Pls/PosA family non-ribosomal peptide synthetase [Corynebacterium epidermidicanis]AKK03998.1 amino acid adenylation enzyme/thioester reductase family protein [Corynebacterium epidermidicanis]
MTSPHPLTLDRVPGQYLRGAEAAPPRTLYDILVSTASANPDAAAIDDGTVLTYADLMEEVDALANHLHDNGIRRGDRIGIRMSSGSKDLYLAILATIAAGAAYVPVDADDPEERADMVFGEADVNAVFTDEGLVIKRRSTSGDTRRPQLDDDAWIIFTSGSTGKPKGVAVSHRSAAAFVDAEAQLFLVNSPGGPLGADDRVLAGLSVAFDASCEEMWLAWGHGACLVPAPRSLVRSGMDLGPWLIRQDITVVSTVPTLAGMWPAEALDNVRLLIFGGEACPPELVERLATADREVWNTYGPTEATVVACATTMHPNQPVSIGLPLAGWDLVVVDKQEQPVAVGEVGELVIGGVGLARYLDPLKDAEKYAPMPSIGWERAYRSGDHVRLEEDGLYFVGRVDDQVKIGGRRIELGEVEAGVASLPNVRMSAVAVQTTGAGDKVLVGYVALEDPAQSFDHAVAHARLSEIMPAALVPRIHVMDDIPVRTSGKADKKALPWPLPGTTVEAADLTATQQWLAELWVETLGISVDSKHADFFELGGTSLAAATLVGSIRDRVPTVSVRDLYDHPRLELLAERVDAIAAASGITIAPTETVPQHSQVRPVGAGTRLAQLLIQLPAMTLAGTQWIAGLALLNSLLSTMHVGWAVPISWWVSGALGLIFLTPLGRLPIGALLIRALTGSIQPGDYPRGGSVHLRIWAAERLADTSGAQNISGATWILTYARLIGAKIGRAVDLHTLPPVTGLLTLGDHAAVEPEVDLTGYWVEGDVVHVGAIEVGANARIGARSTLLPGTVIGEDAHVEAGSTITADKKVKAGARWAGSPARKVGRSKHRFPDEHPPRRSYWVPLYGLTSMWLSIMPLLALAAGALVVIVPGQRFASSGTGWTALGWALAFTPLGALTAFATFMILVWLQVRLCGLGIRPGVTPVRSLQGWRLWTTERLLDDARTYLFPLYASQLTPVWFRSLGAKVGKNAEISTSVMIPKLADIREGSFLADDTLIGGYELGGGWMLTDVARIGKRSFLGNSGIAGPGRKLGKNSLVAVLSSTPKKARAGSNWWGSPPERLRRVAVSVGEGEDRTYSPGFGVKAARGFVETLRLLAPITSALLFVGVLATLQAIVLSLGLVAAWALSGVVLIVFGVLALLITVLVKWACVGFIRTGDHALWSPFVWLNELQDAFVEGVAAPWYLSHNLGTGSLNTALRLLGAHIGRGAWIESYWFPEADLCWVGRGATVGRGCVVQTHLFQDRVMSLDKVTLGDGATLAPHSVALPAAEIRTDTCVGPGSLVMRGDRVPAFTRWQGNPIEPWSAS